MEKKECKLSKKFHYVSIKTHWVDSILRNQIISINEDMNVVKQETIRFIRDNSKMTYTYKCKNGTLKVQYRGNTLESYTILYISQDSKDTGDETNYKPITGNIMFVDTDLDLDEDEPSDFNR